MMISIFARAAGARRCIIRLRLKQFAAFDALKGFRELIEAAEVDAKEEYDR